MGSARVEGESGRLPLPADAPEPGERHEAAVLVVVSGQGKAREAASAFRCVRARSWRPTETLTFV